LAKAPKRADPVKAMGTILTALEALEEADRQWVLQSIATKLSLTIPDAAAGGDGGGSGGGGTGGAGGAGQQRRAGNQDAATFLREKKPGTDKQRVAVLAYYLTHFKNTPEFKKADLEKMNTEARGGSFNLDDALSNASKPSTNYLSAVGGGKKQLTSFADQIVDALPNQEAVRALEKSEKPGKRRRKGKSKKS
jgi:hypothetical protein